MSDTLSIRPSIADDHDAILAIYPEAFPDEDLTGLVKALLDHEDVTSLSALMGDIIIGHMALAKCGVTDSDSKLALLGPLCVSPDAQKAGVGKSLIEIGAHLLKTDGIAAMLVLGDPKYYTPRGFSEPSPIKPEWAEAWRIRQLTDDTPSTGTLIVPEPWADEALWA